MSTQTTEDAFERVPGLYGAWDIGLLLDEDKVFPIEDGGHMGDGRALYMVFTRPALLTVRLER